MDRAVTAAARSSRTGDEPALRQLWKTCFDDPDSVVAQFFRDVYTPGAVSIAEHNGIPVSAAYAIDGARFVPPSGLAHDIRYIYAVGTLPEYRGQGLGQAVTLMAQGGVMSALLPADDGLRRWYESKMGAETAFYIRTRTFQRHELGGGKKDIIMSELSPREYSRLRERLLDGHPHMSFSGKLLEWQRDLSSLTGGGLYALRSGGDISLAAVETGGGFVRLTELLPGSLGAVELVAAVAERFHAEEYVARIPAFIDAPGFNIQPFVMLLPSPFALEIPFGAYWGFAFD